MFTKRETFSRLFRFQKNKIVTLIPSPDNLYHDNRAGLRNTGATPSIMRRVLSSSA